MSKEDRPKIEHCQLVPKFGLLEEVDPDNKAKQTNTSVELGTVKQVVSKGQKVENDFRFVRKANPSGFIGINEQVVKGGSIRNIF